MLILNTVLIETTFKLYDIETNNISTFPIVQLYSRMVLTKFQNNFQHILGNGNYLSSDWQFVRVALKKQIQKKCYASTSSKFHPEYAWLNKLSRISLTPLVREYIHVFRKCVMTSSS